MNTNATVAPSFDHHRETDRRELEGSGRHVPRGKSPPPVRGQYQQSNVQSSTASNVTDASNVGSKLQTGDLFSSVPRTSTKPVSNTGRNYGGGGDHNVYRDPYANGHVSTGRVTPPPCIKANRTHEGGSDPPTGVAAEVTTITTMVGTAAVTETVSNIDNTRMTTSEEYLLGNKERNAIPPASLVKAVTTSPTSVRDIFREVRVGDSRNISVETKDMTRMENNENKTREDNSQTTITAVVAAAPRKIAAPATTSSLGVATEQQQQQKHPQYQQSMYVDPNREGHPNSTSAKGHSMHLSNDSSTATATANTNNTTASLGPTASTAGGSTMMNYVRPAVALSVHLVTLYKRINEMYCRQRRVEIPGPKYNNGFDDKEGHYLVLSGEEILNRYTVQEVLGKGSFGTVLRCYDEKRRENVALKITRHGLSFRTQAKLELDILLKLNVNPNLNHLVVKLLKVFDWQGHLVLVFELLSFNLYQLIKCTRYNGVTLDLVRKFAYQLVQVLYQLEQTKPSPIIHCDIKPENILLRNQNRSGIRLIDFGSACYADKVIHKYIQSRYYRSPEVILYLEYGTAIDRWSLGCVLVELHTGMPLFDGRTEAAQLARFEAMLGPPPADMLEASPKRAKFYDTTDRGLRLREPPLPTRPLESVIGVTTGGPRGARKGQAGHSEEAYKQFHDFVSRLLQYRPAERMSCYDALRHPFLEPMWTADQQQQQQRAQQIHQQQQQQQQQKQQPEPHQTAPPQMQS
ncbi:Protein kinase domain [Trypanosoma melophagium]|uniref:Protein kinase domain n=1 Tax=Trypanosoma melophagium TaxID=715481 RepID=UPI003519DFF4|nr:Protein kinase domain [Trypanosoma melophagium]